MNIFVLDTDPVIAAKYNCNKHVIKMTTELWQQMGSALRRHGATDSDMPPTKQGTPLKGGHPHHPCTRWTGETRSNFLWAAKHATELAFQYSIRYNKVHFCLEGIMQMESMADMIPSGRQTSFAMAMPEEYQDPHDVVGSYRRFYLHDKKYKMQVDWEKRETPYWWN